jgi:hypothetical protein
MEKVGTIWSLRNSICHVFKRKLVQIDLTLKNMLSRLIISPPMAWGWQSPKARAQVCSEEEEACVIVMANVT